ncbi:MAG: hypothetical protein AAB654_21570 [Acidobacteriota bacterium]
MKVPATRPQSDGFNDKVRALVEAVLPLLAQPESGVQAACLAELVAMWLACHETEHLQEALLNLHVEQVRTLLPMRVADLRQRRDVH